MQGSNLVCERSTICKWKVHEGVPFLSKMVHEKLMVGPRGEASPYKTLLNTPRAYQPVTLMQFGVSRGQKSSPQPAGSPPFITTLLLSTLSPFKGAMSRHLLSFKKSSSFSSFRLVCYSRLYIDIETVSCRLLLCYSLRSNRLCAVCSETRVTCSCFFQFHVAGMCKI